MKIDYYKKLSKFKIKRYYCNEKIFFFYKKLKYLRYIKELIIKTMNKKIIIVEYFQIQHKKLKHDL